MRTATDDAVTEFHPTHLPISDQGLDERTRRELLQNLVSEEGFAHRGLPRGAGLKLIANGNLEPAGDAYRQMLYQKGMSAAPGDRVAITAVSFAGDTIVLDLNGGPYVKHRFLSHVQINDSNVVAPQDPATGCRLTLKFEGGLPEITAAEVKALLAPVVDFGAKSSAEAYANTLPPKVREAIAAHEVLVGMNRQMVLAAMGAPTGKTREHADGNPAAEMLEEWMYTAPPKPTEFIRFRGDRVIRTEVAAIGKPVVVVASNQLGADTPSNTRVIANGDVVAARDAAEEATSTQPPPSLRRPGDAAEPSLAGGSLGKVVLPGVQPAPNPATGGP